ncbi:HD domain-containing protein [Falsirhodobacter halotolerans]|uniref:HD domain-containing protein n=1 Tax=Falsirhodobacter halotolerans TaxID=1146892 RepID=UPI001FD444E3|nr:HD domain-containing protein [Falsirhodobacter halotolerans]MCJ8139460.1 HD domain-containing protein [Falsirhodobacter halotolerans]
MTDRLSQQFAFLQEADRLKTVLRASRLADGSRHENTAEHSWHVTLFAMVLADQAPAGVDLNRVLRMLILHDLVEIDTGDVPLHFGDGTAHDAQTEAETRAAERLFGLLPDDQRDAFLDLWLEFEASTTADAMFAKSLDRLPPVLLNMANGGGSWTEYDVTLAQFDARVGTKVSRTLPALWTWLRARALPFFAGRA